MSLNPSQSLNFIIYLSELNVLPNIPINSVGRVAKISSFQYLLIVVQMGKCTAENSILRCCVKLNNITYLSSANLVYARSDWLRRDWTEVS